MAFSYSTRTRGPKALGASRRLLDLAFESKAQNLIDTQEKDKTGRQKYAWLRCSSKVVLLLNVLMVSISCGLLLGAVYAWRGHSEIQHLSERTSRGVSTSANRRITPSTSEMSRGLSETTSTNSLPEQHTRKTLPASRLSKKKGLWVDFGVVGNQVEFSEAFYSGRPYAHEEDVRFEQLEQSEEEDVRAGRLNRKEIRFFVAVTATACSEGSRDRRNAIRRTWMHDAGELGTDIKVRFFIGQPDGCNKTMIARLKKEIQEHGDIAFIRQHDVYENLFNKTHSMLKYYLSDPGKYTHVLKTDEDVYVRFHKVLEALNDSSNGPRMNHVYKGFMENPKGFSPFRDPMSKWYQSYGEFDEDMAREVRGTRYLAGWGYVLSRDVAFHALKKFQRWELKPETAPRWQHKFHNLEDIMVGILVTDYVAPDSDYRFKPAWRKCTRSTAVIHLDIDAPELFDSLHEQDRNGIWDTRTVRCSTGNFVSGDWWAWFLWRNSRFADGQKTAW